MVQWCWFPVCRKKWQLLYMIFFFFWDEAYIRPHCVGCMCALRAYILFLSRPFSRQWSERLPLSFSAASLTSSPVCLKDICYASPLFIHRALATNTIPTNCPPPQAAQSPRHPYCNSPIERENFHIQIAALTDYVCETHTDRSLSYDDKCLLIQ